MDAAVYDQLFPRLTRDGEVVAGFPGRWPFHPGSAHDAEVRTVTTSLDAALTLAERLLEGWTWDVARHSNGLYRAGLYKPKSSFMVASSDRSAPALALCIATLRAKQGEGE
ncbi:hypothetical protein D3C80_1403590 [compost metagenome]